MIKQLSIALLLITATTQTEEFFTEWCNHMGLPTMIQVEEKLESCQSEYQKIDIYKTTTFGMMMVIDDVIMLTQRDNPAYHEMITHVPMITHPNPKKVLIVGGGDGGTLHEVLKHNSVEEVVLCDIDSKVIELSYKYFPEFREAFEDKRTVIVNEDAAEYIKTRKGFYDVICVDSTDPFGPGEALFQKEFYDNIKEALTDDGIAVTQSESMFLYTDLIEELYQQNRKLFPIAHYYYALVPTYPSGTIGFSFVSKKYDIDKIDKERIAQLKNLQYYNEQLHQAAFQLPEFLKKKLLTKSLS